MMVFSTDEAANKVVVCAGVPQGDSKVKEFLEVSEWVAAAMEPINGRSGKGKAGLASGQVREKFLCLPTNLS